MNGVRGGKLGIFGPFLFSRRISEEAFIPGTDPDFTFGIDQHPLDSSISQRFEVDLGRLIGQRVIDDQPPIGSSPDFVLGNGENISDVVVPKEWIRTLPNLSVFLVQNV